MAVLEKIRVKFGILITVLIAVALLSFIVDPSTLRSAVQMFSSDNEVGEMNGKTISYKDFYTEVENLSNIAELMGQNVNSEEAQSQIRDAAWQAMFDKYVFIPTTEKAGIAVGTDELYDLTQGSNISPLLTQQSMFVDENGQFSREALANFVQSIDMDPSGATAQYWNSLEESIYKQQLYTKYATLLESSLVKNEIEKNHNKMDNNVTSTVQFVMVPSIPTDSDTTLNVSAAEIKTYYNEHKHLMNQIANRDIEYVMYEVVPSQNDIDEAKAAFDEVYAEFAESDNLRNFIALNSDSRWNTMYYSEAQLESVPEFAEFAFGKDNTGISPIHTEAGISYSAVRVADQKVLADSANIFVTLFPFDAEAQADSVFAAVQAAKEAPADFQEMGWMTQAYLQQAGLESLTGVFDPEEGKVLKVKDNNLQAFLIAYVADRTKAQPKVQLATLMKNINPSDETYRDFQILATDLAIAADGKYEKFAEFVRANNLPVIPINNITEATRNIGQVENAREVVRWAFEKGTKEGSVSEVLTVNNKYYFVAAVTKVRKEGTATIRDVAPQIRDLLLTEKRIEKIKSEVEAKVASCSDMESVAEALNTTVSVEDAIAFGSQTQSFDPKFLGAISAAQPGGRPAIVDGSIGVYVFQVMDRETGSFYTDDDVKNATLRDAMYQTQILQSVLDSDAKIKDNRARFF